MASMSAVSMALPITKIGQKSPMLGSEAFFQPMKLSPKVGACSSKIGTCRLEVQASSSMKEKAVAGLTAAALAAALIAPEIAEAAQPGVSPSLKNFLLSIVSGGVVVGVIIGAVVGVANFDPVKRS